MRNRFQDVAHAIRKAQDGGATVNAPYTKQVGDGEQVTEKGTITVPPMGVGIGTWAAIDAIRKMSPNYRLVR